MRKLLLSLFAVSCFIVSRAQDAETTAARQLVDKNRAAIGLSADDLNNIFIANTYKVDGRQDIRMVYLQQSYKGVPVFNELQVLAFKNDQLVSNAGSRIGKMEAKVNVNDASPAITVESAVQLTLADAKLSAKQPVVAAVVNGAPHKYEFGTLGISFEKITAELLWLPTEDKSKVRLAWQVFITPTNSSDYWLVRIDAMNGTVLGKQNLTITCNWGDGKHTTAEHYAKGHGVQQKNTLAPQKDQLFKWEYKPFVVSSANYRVVPYPYESPTHLGGTGSQLVTDPWTMAAGNATSLGWHNDGTAYHDSTRGNNVWAAEDRLNTNTIIEKAAVSTTAQPNLTFDFTPDYTQAPTIATNQNFAITNLFYWNNIMHDVLYLYGFTEQAGNFQMDNQGRGGLGGDYVIADAQDGGGTNNANFGTPNDGARPRMQMYLWTAPNPDRDGDLDNSIVAHEFAHGISNRLTGGPGNSSCLGNAEQAGEGWSDYYALMVTTNWATATVGDGAIGRGIGTYALNQPTTGLGIRAFRYSTNLAINPRVYSATLPTAPHDRGEFWCAALWEMTWEIIQQAGINPNLFNPAAGGGNAVAFKLVTEGMRLQPCSPGFIDARNAILRADTLFFGAQYSCAIWRAFAKRGMGRNASQGSSNSVTDQVPSFAVDNGTFSITQSAPQVQEGQNVTYTNSLTAGVCSPITNFFITDTLPANVTYVSGGTYNAGNRTITFGPVNLATGQTQTYPFTVTVNPGTYFAPVEHINEPVAAASIPATWTATSINATVWTTSTTQSQSSPNAFFSPNSTGTSDLSLATTNSYTLNATPSSYTTLSFWHRYNTEDGWDGGVVEVSTNGGASWSDLGSKMKLNPYNGSLGTGSALASRTAFTGNSGAFVRTLIDLSSYAGQSIKIRFRFASDDNTAPAGGGWYVDDIVLSTEPAVTIKSNLFNASSALQSVTDTITRILPGVACTPVTVTTQPTDVTTCSGSTATYTVAATGTAAIGYQWQINTGSGFTNITNAAPYGGATTATLTITGVTAGMNSYQYRCVVTNPCSSVNSNSVTLTVTAVATINTQPANSTVCATGNTSFSVVATGATGYQWQVNTGSGFTDITNGAPYSGATTATLTITGVAANMNTYQYRCVLTSCGPVLNSNAATLSTFAAAVVSSQPSSAAVCQGTGTTFAITASGAVTGYQWQVSADGGNTYNNITGATNATLSLTIITSAMDGNRYRCVVSGNCNTANSNPAVLTVYPLPVFTIGAVAPLCVSDPAVTLTTSFAGGSWSGAGIQGNVFTPSQAGVGAALVTFTATNSFGCSSAQSATIQVNECPERHLTLAQPNSIIVYPNPNDGRFSIRIKSDLFTRMGMRVYASDGKLVNTQSFSGLYYDRVVPVDLSSLAAGVYQLFLYNDEGNTLVKRTFSIIIAR